MIAKQNPENSAARSINDHLDIFKQLLQSLDGVRERLNLLLGYVLNADQPVGIAEILNLWHSRTRPLEVMSSVVMSWRRFRTGWSWNCFVSISFVKLAPLFCLAVPHWLWHFIGFRAAPKVAVRPPLIR